MADLELTDLSKQAEHVYEAADGTVYVRKKQRKFQIDLHKHDATHDAEVSTP